jgi:hypothetical protein
MGIKKLALVAALGLSMASAPVMAQSVSTQRSSAVLQQASAQDDDDGGGASRYIVAFFVIVAVGLGLYFAFNKDDDGRTSP